MRLCSVLYSTERLTMIIQMIFSQAQSEWNITHPGISLSLSSFFSFKSEFNSEKSQRQGIYVLSVHTLIKKKKKIFLIYKEILRDQE
jgi:hypothetical protein